MAESAWFFIQSISRIFKCMKNMNVSVDKEYNRHSARGL